MEKGEVTYFHLPTCRSKSDSEDSYGVDCKNMFLIKAVTDNVFSTVNKSFNYIFYNELIKDLRKLSHSPNSLQISCFQISSNQQSQTNSIIQFTNLYKTEKERANKLLCWPSIFCQSTKRIIK